LIVVPPLSERPEDIKPLTEHFIEKYAKENKRDILEISDCFWKILLGYHFPGNVRELENLIQRAVIMCESNVLEARDLSMDLVCWKKPGLNVDSDVLVKAETLLEALKQITIFTPKRQKKLWHKSLRCISIYDIHRFLMERGNIGFSRKRFEEFLRTCSKSDLCKYKTAGHFLSILKANYILEHNSRKANASEYCLADIYIEYR
jgi:Nif-specific regulatory protein